MVKLYDKEKLQFDENGINSEIEDKILQIKNKMKGDNPSFEWLVIQNYRLM